MSEFATQQATAPLRIVQVGAGGMGKAWLNAIMSNPEVELVGLVELNLELAQTALGERGVHGVLLGTSVAEVAAATGAHAVVNVTVPQAHHVVNVETMFAGLPVLCEKPAAPTVAQALSLAAASEVSGELLMISQSRRYFNTLAQLRAATASLGELGIISTEFFKAPHFGGFREEMDHVLLLDMAIHAFDVVRYLSGQEPVSVYCEEFNPGWSWYEGNAAASATFEFTNGLRYIYTGSWCADGHETSWNGSWRVNGSRGTATWDGENAPDLDLPDQAAVAQLPAFDGAEQIAGSLAEFIAAVKTGSTPSGEIHEHIYSLAMVEAAVLSAKSAIRVRIDDVLEAAYGQALADERSAEVRAALVSWGSPLEHLGRAGQVAAAKKFA